MYLLDTNVVSELRKARGGRAVASVVEWAVSVPAVEQFLSVISLQELELGVLLAERSDPERGAVFRSWLDQQVVPTFRHRTLPVTADVARLAARFDVPDPVPIRDGLIAATALHDGLTVVTRNRRDFERFEGLAVLDPWS